MLRRASFPETYRGYTIQENKKESIENLVSPKPGLVCSPGVGGECETSVEGLAATEEDPAGG